MAVKRLIEGVEEDQVSDLEMKSLRTANYLILLSRGHDHQDDDFPVQEPHSRVFECKTCNRQFQSFQALGGHRASHKKPRTADDGCRHSSPAKPKVHECSICGLEFAIGQALGGHMRRHRNAVEGFSVEKKQENKKVLYLDLNLPPSEEIEQPDQLALGIGLVPKMSIVH